MKRYEYSVRTIGVGSYRSLGTELEQRLDDLADEYSDWKIINVILLDNSIKDGYKEATYQIISRKEI